MDGRVVLSRRIPSGKRPAPPATAADASGSSVPSARPPPPAGGRWVTLGTHSGHAHDVRALALPLDAGAVLSGSADGMVGCLRVPEVGARRPARVFPFFQRPLASVVAAPGARLLAAQGPGGALQVWGLGAGKPSASPAGDGGSAVVLGRRSRPGRHTLWLSVESGSTAASRAAGRAPARGGGASAAAAGGGSAAGLAASPDGRWLACADPGAPGGLRLLWLDIAQRRKRAAAATASADDDEDEEEAGDGAGVADVDAVGVALPAELSAALTGCGCPSQLHFASPLALPAPAAAASGGEGDGGAAGRQQQPWLLAVVAGGSLHVLLCASAGVVALLTDERAAAAAVAATSGTAPVSAGKRRRAAEGADAGDEPAVVYLYELPIPRGSSSSASAAAAAPEADAGAAAAAGERAAELLLPGLRALHGAARGPGRPAAPAAAVAKAPLPLPAAAGALARTAIRIPGSAAAARPAAARRSSAGSESDASSSDASSSYAAATSSRAPASPPPAPSGRGEDLLVSNRKARRLSRMRTREGTAAARLAPVFITAVASAPLQLLASASQQPPAEEAHLAQALALAAPGAAALLALATHRASLLVFRLGVGSGGALVSSAPARLPCAATALLLARVAAAPPPAAPALVLVAALRSGGLAACDLLTGLTAPWARPACQAFVAAWGPASSSAADAPGGSGSGGGGGAFMPASAASAAEPVRQLLELPRGDEAAAATGAPSPLLRFLAVGAGGHVCSVKLLPPPTGEEEAGAAEEEGGVRVTAAVLPSRFSNVLMAAVLPLPLESPATAAAAAAAVEVEVAVPPTGKKGRRKGVPPPDAATPATAAALAAAPGGGCELAVVELPWRVYSGHLAAVVHRKKYGA